MEVLKARVTFASICTTLPNLIGVLKLMLSTLAVMLAELQCLVDAIAAAISIQYISRPPIRLPKTLVSLGNTISFITVKLSIAFLLSITLIYSKDNLNRH